MEKETKQSDRLSNNDSDLKVEIRTASSLSNMPEHDSEHWDDEGSEALKNESLYRYSDYIDPVFPPKSVRKIRYLFFLLTLALALSSLFCGFPLSLRPYFSCCIRLEDIYS